MNAEHENREHCKICCIHTCTTRHYCVNIISYLISHQRQTFKQRTHDYYHSYEKSLHVIFWFSGVWRYKSYKLHLPNIKRYFLWYFFHLSNSVYASDVLHLYTYIYIFTYFKQILVIQIWYGIHKLSTKNL